MKDSTGDYTLTIEDLYNEYLKELEKTKEYNTMTKDEQKIYRIKDSRESLLRQSIVSLLFVSSPALFASIAYLTDNQLIKIATILITVGVGVSVTPMVNEIKDRYGIYKLSKTK